MRISIVAPRARIRTGNHCTADQWAALWTAAGHSIVTDDAEEAPDIVVALHADKSFDEVCALRDRHPGTCVVVALTGTDLYPQLSARSLESLEQADRIVVLQERALDRLPATLRNKARVIVQGVDAPAESVVAHSDSFDICYVGHLREVKDPLRAALAARLLPESSRVRVLLAGDVLDEAFREPLEREVAENDRFEWLGAIPADAVSACFQRSRASVVSSYFEGGARVLGESVVAGTPVLAARNDATVALLGDAYPALYEPGDTQALADLMHRVETDDAFRGDLESRMRELSPIFDPARERAAWAQLLAECARIREGARDAV